MNKAEKFIRNHTSNCSNVVACSGMIEGVKAQIEGVLDAINKEIEDFKED